MSKVSSITMMFLILFSMVAEASICTGVDNREPSNVKPVGRVSSNPNSPCSVTLISKSCVVTAGHCEGLFENVEFNTPLSDSNTGSAKYSKKKDIYPVVGVNGEYDGYQGRTDYAVLRLGRNKKTGKLPGDVQGFAAIDFYYFTKPGDLVTITGYGASKKYRINNSQATHNGRIHRFNLQKQKLEYHVDTTGGSSGSAIFDVYSNKIIGVHTNGGCGSSTSSTNFGTLLSLNEPFKSAIRECLSKEGSNPFKFD